MHSICRESLWGAALAITVAGGCYRDGPSPKERGQAALDDAGPAEKATVDVVDARSHEAEDAEVASVKVAAPDEPPYDLDADRQRLIEQAQHDIGHPIDVRVLAGVWVFLGMPGFTGGQFRAAVSFAERVLERLMSGRFDRGPRQAIAVYLFGTAVSYESYCARVLEERCLSPYGFFLPASRKLVMNMRPGWGTLSHEMVHPILEADFPGAPTWLNEGIASLFEAVVLSPNGEIHGAKNWRYPTLRAALDSRRHGADRASLEHLFSLSNAQFRGSEESLNYALARYFCQWLDTQGKLWAFYRAYRDDAAHDRSGRGAFLRVMGRDLEAANAEFESWVRLLR